MTSATQWLTAVLFAGFVSSPLLAAPSACETYAKAPDSALRVVKTVDPLKEALGKAETGMVQATILAGNPAEPLTADEALAVFKDVDGEGSNAGQLVYSDLKVGTRTVTVVRVTYYPGDNEYGALFTYRKLDSGYEAVDLIGQIQDGDVVCLTYVD